MYSDFAVNKYLHAVASGWIFIKIFVPYLEFMTSIRIIKFGRLTANYCNVGRSYGQTKHRIADGTLIATIL